MKLKLGVWQLIPYLVIIFIMVCGIMDWDRVMNFYSLIVWGLGLWSLTYMSGDVIEFIGEQGEDPVVLAKQAILDGSISTVWDNFRLVISGTVFCILYSTFHGHLFGNVAWILYIVSFLADQGMSTISTVRAENIPDPDKTTEVEPDVTDISESKVDVQEDNTATNVSSNALNPSE